MFGVLIASAWSADNPESLREYAMFVASKEQVPVSTILKIGECESSFNPKAHNTSDPNGGSRGVFQFQERTFYDYAKKYNIDNPDIWNPFQQINLAIYMIRDGKIGLWSCSKMI